MESIKKPFKSVLKLIGEQDVNFGDEYRPITFSLVTEVEGRKIAYNTLTGELVVINEAEQAMLTGEKLVADDSSAELIKKWFLVPLDNDDMRLRNELVAFGEVFLAGKKKKAFTILPTTDCNARCFYCFELGRSRLHMTDEIAKDTVDYILKNGEKKITLKWFGGEPLYNVRVIDIITEGLRNAGVEYKSSMVSNAYLFDDEIVRRAVNDWKLDNVQVTLDGTEEVYNRIKAYIYKDGKSPFQIVMDNIERLLKADILVTVRLNVSNENFEDLMDLATVLGERFGTYSKLKVYSHRLFEFTDRPDTIMSDLDRMELDRKWLELEDKIHKLGIGVNKPLAKDAKYYRCMADSPVASLILPDGHLGRCEHHTDSNFVGDIYNGETDKEMLAKFKERVDSDEICKGCKLYPSCIQLKMCSAERLLVICDEATRKYKEEELYGSVERAVKRYFAK